MNQFTIEFKDAKDLSKKIAEYNALMNSVNEAVEVSTVKEKVKKAFKEQTASVESPKEKPQMVVEPPVKEVQEAEIVKTETEPTPVGVVDTEKVEEPTAEPAEETTEPPVTDFDGNPVEPKPAEDVPAVEEVNEPVDKKAYWAKLKAWMGEDKELGAKVYKVFLRHGVPKPTSDSLTDEIMAELDELMA
ncbi:hypothetical protein [Veillonella caviae]|uniref:hypothetical protein n=1 Tax=Veillonella caviae TaxID=248316 RepID=UPI0023F225F6|nr:hypothetical protein [Veillonella caviae]MCI6407290.1 hypothetical protein [Veillonella caviae]